MRNKQQHTIQTLIRNWIKGDSKAHHSLGQLAKDDPFLKDAMDGYESNEGNHLERLNRLDDRLQERIGSKKKNRVVYMMQRAVAVAAILLMVFGSFWWLNNSFDDQRIVSDNTITSKANESGNDRIIQEQAKAETIDIVDNEVKQDDFPEPKKKIAAVQPKKNSDTKIKKKTPVSTPKVVQEKEVKTFEIAAGNSEQIVESQPEPEIIKTEMPPEEAGIIVLSEEVNESSDAIVYDEAESAYYADSPVTYEQDAAYMSTSPVEQSEVAASAPEVMATMAIVDTFMIKGIVYDTENEPIFGASIVELNTENGTITDFDGRFELSLSTPNHQIQVSYIGFEDVVLTPSLDSINSFVLEQGTADLDAVIISDYSSLDRDSIFQYLDTDISVYPKDGYEQFYKYLDEELLYPQSAVAKQVEGVVRLRFEIDANGTPQNVEIQESVGYGCDEEAVRLLKEGPNWKTKEGGTTTNLSIQFRLKENEEKVKKKDGN